jgi:GMP synthase PP-ATPase subunit
MNDGIGKDNFLEKLKFIHQRFISVVNTAYKKHSDGVRAIMKQIETRKIEKLSAEIKSHHNG